MENYIIHIIVISYTLLILWVLLLAKTRKIKFIHIFLISLFLTPVTGLFVVLFSSPKITITEEVFEPEEE